MIRNKVECNRITVDLTGPDGNAFVLLGMARNFAKQLEYNVEDIEALHTDMTSSDYEHLISVFDKHFGTFVILERWVQN